MRRRRLNPRSIGGPGVVGHDAQLLLVEVKCHRSEVGPLAGEEKGGLHSGGADVAGRWNCTIGIVKKKIATCVARGWSGLICLISPGSLKLCGWLNVRSYWLRTNQITTLGEWVPEAAADPVQEIPP